MNSCRLKYSCRSRTQYLCEAYSQIFCKSSLFRGATTTLIRYNQARRPCLPSSKSFQSPQIDCRSISSISRSKLHGLRPLSSWTRTLNRRHSCLTRENFISRKRTMAVPGNCHSGMQNQIRHYQQRRHKDCRKSPHET